MVSTRKEVLTSQQESDAVPVAPTVASAPGPSVWQAGSAP